MGPTGKVLRLENASKDMAFTTYIFHLEDLRNLKISNFLLGHLPERGRNDSLSME